MSGSPAGRDCGAEEKHTVAKPTIDPEEFLAQLRSEHRVLQWEPLAPQSVRPLGTQDQVRSAHLLEYLHHHWVLPDSFDASGTGRGIRGRLVRMFGRLTYSVLQPYLHAERDLLAHVVQVNDALERRCDELTLRCQQLNQDLVDRQVAEARNQTKLAVWLDLDPPSTGTDPRDDGEARSR
jgi:hypothetical protein